MIDYYSFGKMEANGETHQNDLKIINGQIKGEWWRKQGHLLSVDDLQDIFEASPRILVIGNGYSGNMRVPDSVKQALEDKNINVTVAKTRDAVKKFNSLVSEKKDVAGAFHLTC